MAEDFTLTTRTAISTGQWRLCGCPAGRSGSAGGHVERTELPLAWARNRPRKTPKSPKFSTCRLPASGPRPRASAPSWGAPRREPSGPEGPLGVADSLPPAARIRRSPPCARPPGKARRARHCGHIGTSRLLPDPRSFARENRGCPCTFGASSLGRHAQHGAPNLNGILVRQGCEGEKMDTNCPHGTGWKHLPGSHWSCPRPVPAGGAGCWPR